jgi:hypothetical protein
MSLRQDEGTIAFWINHPHADWPTNGSGATWKKGVVKLYLNGREVRTITLKTIP